MVARLPVKEKVGGSNPPAGDLHRKKEMKSEAPPCGGASIKIRVNRCLQVHTTKLAIYKSILIHNPKWFDKLTINDPKYSNNMNSDLTLVPLEAARARSEEPLTGFITPNSRAKLPEGQQVAYGAGATGQANEKNQTLLNRFRVLIKDARFFDVEIYDLMK